MLARGARYGTFAALSPSRGSPARAPTAARAARRDRLSLHAQPLAAHCVSASRQAGAAHTAFGVGLRFAGGAGPACPCCGGPARRVSDATSSANAKRPSARRKSAGSNQIFSRVIDPFVACCDRNRRMPRPRPGRGRILFCLASALAVNFHVPNARVPRARSANQESSTRAHAGRPHSAARSHRNALQRSDDGIESPRSPRVEWPKVTSSAPSFETEEQPRECGITQHHCRDASRLTTRWVRVRTNRSSARGSKSTRRPKRVTGTRCCRTHARIVVARRPRATAPRRRRRGAALSSRSRSHCSGECP